MVGLIRSAAFVTASWVRLIAAALTLFAAPPFGAAQTPAHPNLIWIMADDLGYGELGCYGQRVIQTPRLDRMAREGLRFTQFYAGATVCAPSRSVLMTGQHHGHTRVRGNAGAQNPRAQALRAEDATIAKTLQRAGYATALIGKWGLGDIGDAESGLPGRQGFDEFFGFLNQQHAHNHFPDFLWKNTERVALPNKIEPVGNTGAGYAIEAKEYADDRFAAEVLRYVRQPRSQPFFLFWSMVTPHANNERTRALRDGTETPDYGPYADEHWPAPDKGHAAMISRLDQDVGRLLDALRDAGLADRTLVIFTSDNGPHRESNHDLERFRPAGPLRGTKRSLTDGGIRVPCLAWWPGQIAPNSTTDHVAYFGDWFATACELAGVSDQVPADRDSLSFAPTLRGAADQRRHEFLYWEFHEGGFQQAALYQGRWKGLRRQLDGPLELYDLRTDLGEERNVATEHPELVDKLEAYLKRARSESDDWPARPRAKAKG